MFYFPKEVNYFLHIEEAEWSKGILLASHLFPTHMNIWYES